MKDLFKGIVASIKAELSWKKVLLWFGGGFVVILSVFVLAFKQLGPVQLLSSLGMALVLVACVVCTEAYYHFINVYYNKIKRKLPK